MRSDRNTQTIRLREGPAVDGKYLIERATGRGGVELWFVAWAGDSPEAAAAMLGTLLTEHPRALYRIVEVIAGRPPAGTTGNRAEGGG